MSESSVFIAMLQQLYPPFFKLVWELEDPFERVVLRVNA